MNLIVNKNRIIYLLSAIGGHFYILFTIPLLTKYLTKDSFGIYTILTQIVVVVQAALLVLFSNGLLKFWVDTKDGEKKLFIGTIVISFLCVSLIVTITLYIFKDSFLRFFFPNVKTDISIAFYYTLFWLYFISFRSFLLSFLKVLEKPKFILIHIASYGILLVCILYWQLSLQGDNLEGVMLSFFITEIVTIVVLIYPTINNFKLSFKFLYLKSFMKFSLPLIGGSIAFIIFQNIDRVILARYVNLEDMAVYGIGYMFGSISGMVVTANMSAYLPRLKKVMFKGEIIEVRRLTSHYIKDIQDLMLIVVASISIFSEFIIFLFANNYSGTLAPIVMAGVALGHLARCNYLFYEQILFLKDRVVSILLLKIMILFIGAILAILLISTYHLLGAAFLYFSTFLIINVLGYTLTSSYGLISLSIDRLVYIGAIISLFILFLFLDLDPLLIYSVKAFILIFLIYRYLNSYILHKKII